MNSADWNVRYEEVSLSDAPLLAQLMEASDRHFDPNATSVGIAEAEEILNGYFDSVSARKIVDSNDNKVLAIVTVHPDISRARIYADTWSAPGIDVARQSILLTRELSKMIDEKYELWIGANTLDIPYIAELKAQGFELLRTYWGLSMELGPQKLPEIDSKLRMHLIHNDDDIYLWWKVHQDSFSQHFGFMPRGFEEWKALVNRTVGVDENARWLLFADESPVGFIECTDIKKEFETGYIEGLGVIQTAQGNGYGELLLRWALHYYHSINRKFVELNVDSGNESGALRLYEKVGFETKKSWQQFHNPNWANF